MHDIRDPVVERLERRLRTTSGAMVALVAAGLGLSAWAVDLSWHRQPPSMNVEARRFALVDEHGRPRAVLAVQDGGAASLYLTDSRGTPRATMSVAADGTPAIGLGGKNATLRLAMAVSDEGESSIGLFDGDRKLRAKLAVGPDGVPSLNILDDAQHVRALLSVEKNQSLLRIADRAGQTRLGLGLSFGAPGIAVFDRDGSTMARLP
jgi:hypothetical protein